MKIITPGILLQLHSASRIRCDYMQVYYDVWGATLGRLLALTDQNRPTRRDPVPQPNYPRACGNLPSVTSA